MPTNLTMTDLRDLNTALTAIQSGEAHGTNTPTRWYRICRRWQSRLPLAPALQCSNAAVLAAS
jgi:hypothetical protein